MLPLFRLCVCEAAFPRVLPPQQGTATDGCRSCGVLSGYGCEGLRPRPSRLSGTAGEPCGAQPARAVPAGTGALSWTGSCSEVLPRPLVPGSGSGMAPLPGEGNPGFSGG